jgi:hypothetical protein
MYVHRRSRDGALVFRKREGAKVFERRMETSFSEGDPIPDQLFAEVDAIFGERQDDVLRLRAPRPAKTIKDDPVALSRFFYQMEKSARARAKKYKFRYNITKGWCESEYRRGGMMCAVTGMSFNWTQDKRSPFMPSLDRIDPQVGYIEANCRLVTYICNCAMGQFGEDAFRQMCLDAVANNGW